MNIRLLNWPPQSTDLNPIENLWGVIKDKIWHKMYEIHSKNDLIEAIEDIWWEDQ